MTERDELNDLRRLAELEAKAAPQQAPPPMLGVIANAVNKGGAGLVDAFGNLPSNIQNLGKIAYGGAAGALGRPDIAANVELTQPPNFAHRGLTALGLIKPENEPQTLAQRVVDAGTQGGVGMTMNPGAAARQVTKMPWPEIRDILTGIIGGGSAEVVKEKTGSEKAAIATALLTPLATHAVSTMPGAVQKSTPMNNEVRNQTWADSRDAGYAIPPSEVNPSWLNKTLESYGGKTAIKQEATQRNQGTTDKLAATGIELPPKTAITMDRIDALRATHGQASADAAALSPRAAQLVEDIQKARQEATDYWKYYASKPDPDVRKKARQFDADAKMAEQQLDQIAIAQGQPQIVEQLREARTKIAKTHDVERALNLADAHVDARNMGRALDKGKPLTGELETIARFAESFKDYTGHATTPGVSGTNAMASALLGITGYQLSGNNKYAALAAALAPYGRGATRSLVLSGPYQRAMATPERVSVGDTTLKSALLARAIAERNQ